MLVMLLVSLWTLIDGDATARADGVAAPSSSLSGEGNQRLARNASAFDSEAQVWHIWESWDSRDGEHGELAHVLDPEDVQVELDPQPGGGVAVVAALHP